MTVHWFAIFRLIFNFIFMPLYVCVHAHTSCAAVESLDSIHLNAAPSLCITYSIVLEKETFWKKLEQYYQKIRHFPRNTFAFFQQFPCPAILVQLHFTVPVLQWHFQEVFFCRHSLDISHLVSPTSIMDVRMGCIDVNLCSWELMSSDSMVLIWRFLQRPVLIKI